MSKITLSLKNRSIYILLLVGLCLLFSCEKKNDDLLLRDDVVAKVGESILYEEDLKDLMNKSGMDSMSLRKRFINNWLRKEALLQRAKMNLSEEEQNVEDRVNDYRASLLINLYKQKYLQTHLDTLVTDEEVSMYVKEYSESFILKESVYKYYWAKVLNKNKSDLWFIVNLFNKKEVDLMQDFKLKSSTVIGDYGADWHKAESLLENLPEKTVLANLIYLREGKVATFKDDEATYLVRPIKIAKEGDVSPIDYVQDKVKEIILHNRKIQLANKLEYEIYEDAKKNKQFEVY